MRERARVRGAVACDVLQVDAPVAERGEARLVGLGAGSGVRLGLGRSWGWDLAWGWGWGARLVVLVGPRALLQGLLLACLAIEQVAHQAEGSG